MEEGLCYVPCNQKYWPYSDNTVDGFCNARMLKARYILSKEKHSDGDSKKKGTGVQNLGSSSHCLPSVMTAQPLNLSESRFLLCPKG